MGDPADVTMTKTARREFSRHGIDLMLCDCRVSKGILYVRGTPKALAGSGLGAGELKSKMEAIARHLRARSQLREVVIDCVYPR